MNKGFQTVALRLAQLTYLNIFVDLLAVISIIMEDLIASDVDCLIL